MSNKDKTALRNVACAKNNSAIINDTDKNISFYDTLDNWGMLKLIKKYQREKKTIYHRNTK